MLELLGKKQEDLSSAEFCVRLKILRKLNNLTIKKLAGKCFITEKSYWNWENGKTMPRAYNKKLLAEILGVSEDVIFGTPKKISN